MAEKNESWGLLSERMQPTADTQCLTLFPFDCQPLPSRQQSSWDYVKWSQETYTGHSPKEKNIVYKSYPQSSDFQSDF